MSATQLGAINRTVHRKMELEGFHNVSPILRAAVYALVARGVVVYIGKSKKPLSRIDAHRKVWSSKRSGRHSWIADTLGIPGIMFDEIHIRPCLLEDLDTLEREMVIRYSPRFNTKLKPARRLPEVMFYNGVEVSLIPRLPAGESIRRI